MKGEFSRFTFDPKKHYTDVLMQQGRVQLDSDWNEMVEIHNYKFCNFIQDMIGPYGGPINNCGFKIKSITKSTIQRRQPHLNKLHIRPGDFLIGEGRYYVDGIMCDNEHQTTYYSQPDFQPIPQSNLDGEERTDLVYLDVWKRNVTALEDPEIMEVALGQDTSTRMKVVWQVKTHRIARSLTCAAIDRDWKDLTNKWQPKNKGMLCAIAKSDSKIHDNTPANQGYSGLENLLYRIEIHKAGRINVKPTFKWSRVNGAVTYIIHNIHVDTSSNITTAELKKPSQNISTELKPNDWVELLDDYSTLDARPGTLLQVKKINNASSKITFHGICSGSICRDKSRQCLMRRWDQKQKNGSEIQEGAVVIREGSDDNSWIDIENGIRIRFEPGGYYRTGDYWLVPARTITSSIEWPCSDGNPIAKPPDGIYHHFAPLSIINVNALGKVKVRDCRSAFRHKLQRPIVIKKKP